MTEPSCLGVGHLQIRVLEILWTEGKPLTVHQLLAAVNEQAPAPLAYTTVLTVARNLASRGLLTQEHVPKQKQHTFSPLITREAFRAQLVQEFVSVYFGGSAAAAAALLKGLK